MALYDIKNVSKNGHVFVELRGIQTLKPGHKKTIELSDADRYHPNLTALEPEHLEISLHKPETKKAEEPKKEEAPAPKKALENPGKVDDAKK